MKLVEKNRHGAKMHEVYYMAQTPYQRLLKAGILTEAKRQELTTAYYHLNPVSLLKQINENLEHLWAMTEYLVYQQGKVKTYKASVTFYDATRVKGALWHFLADIWLGTGSLIYLPPSPVQLGETGECLLERSSNFIWWKS